MTTDTTATTPLRSLSATSIKNYEDCPAMWEATSHTRIPSESGEAALLGTVCHEALEAFVRAEYHLMDREIQAKTLADLYQTIYHANFPSAKMFEDGRRMLMLWLERCDAEYWSNRKVLSTEVKESFTLLLGPDRSVPVPFNFIWDRCDRIHLNDGGEFEIEVVDYKSWRVPRGADYIRDSIQGAAYALAAHQKYPDATRIWVTMDQLRHGPVSVCYTAAEAEATLMRIMLVGNKIFNTFASGSDFEEKPGEGCRYCIRKMTCNAVQQVENVKPLIKSENVNELARAFYRLTHAVKAQQAALEEIGSWLAAEAEHRDTTLIETESFNVSFKATGRRTVTDPHRLAAIVGRDIMARDGSLPISQVDKLLKSDELSDRQKAEIKSLIQKNWSPNPIIEVEPVIG